MHRTVTVSAEHLCYWDLQPYYMLSTFLVIMTMKIIQKHVHLEGRTRCAASPKIVCGLALRADHRGGKL